MRASRFAKPLQALLLSAAMLAMTQARAEQGAQLAWLRDGKVEQVNLSNGAPAQPAAMSGKVPLGSLWKIFVYAYLVDTSAKESAYTCSASTPDEEDHYCCNPGESVARDPALAKSCAPYFAPARLGITATRWTAMWKRYSQAPWLLDMAHLGPETEASVADILEALQAMPTQARKEARAALLQTGMEGYGREAWPQLGSGIRYKTYSWHRADGSAFGGAAGWLADGTPFWFGARGSSRTALATWSAPIARALPEPRWREAGHANDDASCVDVDFFARYPLRAVWKGDAQVQAGTLNGSYRLQFANGNWLTIDSRGELMLTGNEGAPPAITGRMTINDYVARVVDREGGAEPVQAARALAVAARSYLLQNAHFEGACWRIADSSQTQRVSPNPPTDAALGVAWFTDDIVLTGVPVHYHRNAAGANRLSWEAAKSQANAGWSFERILGQAYPKATLAGAGGHSECTRLDAAETWLAHAASAWNTRLEREPGFEALDATPNICALAQGHPYSDQRRLRIYARGWRSLDERITLAHEYVHLVLRFHPHGSDEDYVERLARQLIEG
ncbi:MAG TPA: DUF2300 domain-containing protein [Burkholderiaceae bacterium]